MTDTKEMIIERFMRDSEQKAHSLYNSGVKEGARLATEGAYKMGMADAWEILKRAMELPCGAFMKVFDGADCLEDIRHMEMSEIAKRMEAYEDGQKKASAILVGDEVRDPNGIVAIVTNTDTAYHLLYLHNGKTWKAPKTTKLTKTGKHYAAIRAHKRDE